MAEIVQLDRSNVASTVNALTTLVEDTRAHRQKMQGLLDEAKRIAAQNTASNTPGGIYAPMITALGSAISAITKNLDTLESNLTQAATTLKQRGAAMFDVDEAAGAKIGTKT
jgi:phage major head subunit gpT-like protein